GANIAGCSGDRLLGGRQAGIVLGRGDLVDTMRRHPIARAVRVDKMQVAALEAVLRLYTTGKRGEIPVWRLLETPAGELKSRAGTLAADLPGARARRSESVMGGGSVPGYAIPSWAVEVAVLRAEAIAARLRTSNP